MKASKGLLRGLVVAAASAALIMPSAAFAQGGPPPGHGPGTSRGGGPPAGHGQGGGAHGGGGPGEETTANNLSVPTVFVPGTSSEGAPTLDFACGSAVNPSGQPLTNYPIDTSAYYYVQGIHKWQASCAEAQSASVTAAWGDNLVGTESSILKVGTPIRVEVGLLDNATGLGMTGYNVVKLEPSALDRESAYGTLAESGAENAAPAASSTPYTNSEGVQEVRVWAAGAHLKIYPEGSPNSPIVDEAATAEINSTGRVVYGYTLRVDTAGTYVIEFTALPVTFTGSNARPGQGMVTNDGHTVTLTISVGSGVGGGGGGGHGPGGGGGG